MSPKTFDYSQFFANLYHLSPTTLLSLFFLLFFRLAPIVTIAPFFGSKLPSPVKLGLMICFSLLLLPTVSLSSKTIPDFNTVFILYAIKELFIGFILTFLAIIPFQIAQSAGILIDFLRGSSSLQVADPFTQTESSSIGNLYNYVLVVIFYGIGGVFFLFDSLILSYTIVPVDGFLHPMFFSLHVPFWTFVIAVATKIVAISVQLSAPALLAILMTEVFLGIANRLAPQVQISFLGMSLKSLVGLAMLCVAWMVILQQLEKQTLFWLKEINHTLLAFPKG